MERRSSVERSAAVLVLAGAGYVPAGCWSVRGLRTGDACLDLLPISTGVELGNGDRAEVMGEVPIHHCDSGPDDAPARRGLRLGTIDPTIGIAVWPNLAAVGYHAVASQSLADTTKIEREVQRLAPGVRGEVMAQSWTVDIDGDGDDEAFYSVVVDSATADNPALSFSGLFMDTADGGLRLLFRSEYEVVGIQAVLDIDGDGFRELVLSRRYYEGDRVELVTLTREGLEIIGGWSCGA